MIETVIIGGGQAGLVMSHHLGRLGREHTVFERGRIAERWRSERWDSLTFQFPNWMMRLPGYAYDGDEPNGFMNRDGVVHFIENFAKTVAPPIRLGIRVIGLDSAESGNLVVSTDEFTVEAANVVIATGPYQTPRVPFFSTALPNKIHQVTANRYTNPDQLPPGAVLVVGSGGSGCQIAEDLLRSGRLVYLSIRRHRRVPRVYRGKDFGWWQEKTGASDLTVDTLPPDSRAPLLTGVEGGRDVDLHRLAREGLQLIGSLQDVQGPLLKFAPDLEDNLRKGDDSLKAFKRTVDDYIREQQLDAPAEDHRDVIAEVRPQGNSAIRELDVLSAGITSVIWATGYSFDLSWVRCPVFDTNGRPVHRRGVTAVKGLYFLGLPRLHKVKSAFLWGVGDDAEFLARHITGHAQEVIE